MRRLQKLLSVFSFLTWLVLFNGIFQTILAKPGPELTLFELGAVGMFVCTFLLYFLKKICVGKFYLNDRVIWVLLFYAVAILPLNFVIALGHGINTLEWLKGGIGYINILFVFIIYEELSDKKQIFYFFIAVSVIIFLNISYELAVILLSQSAIGYSTMGDFRSFVASSASLVIACSFLFIFFLFYNLKFKFRYAVFVVLLGITLLRVLVTYSKFLTFVSVITAGFSFFLVVFPFKYIKVDKPLWLAFMGTILALGVSGYLTEAIPFKKISTDIEHEFQRIDYSVEKRLSEWDAAIAQGNKHFLLGNGHGSSFEFYRPGVGRQNYDHSHNFFVQQYKDGGLLLVTAFLIALCTLYIRGVKTFLRGVQKERLIVLTILTSITLLVLHGQVSTHLVTPQTNYYFWIYGACLVKLGSLLKYKRSFGEGLHENNFSDISHK